VVEIESIMEILREAGDVEMYLGELNSLISIGPNLGVRLEHASLTDFLVDPRRSEEFCIKPRLRHTSLAGRCLQYLQMKGKYISNIQTKYF